MICRQVATPFPTGLPPEHQIYLRGAHRSSPGTWHRAPTQQAQADFPDLPWGLEQPVPHLRGDVRSHQSEESPLPTHPRCFPS